MSDGLVGALKELRAIDASLSKSTRRERIATEVLSGFAARKTVTAYDKTFAATHAVAWADALIAELDK